MLELKETSELLEYGYKVCEVFNCENESYDVYELENEKIIDACPKHLNELEHHKFWI